MTFLAKGEIKVGVACAEKEDLSMGYLIAIYCILFAILAWRRMNWALALIVFALPTYLIRFQIGFAPITLLEAMILILFVVHIIQRVRSAARGGATNLAVRQTTQYPLPAAGGEGAGGGVGYGWLIFIFLLTATTAILVSTERVAALGIWKAYFVEPIMFFVVLNNMVCRPEQKKCRPEALEKWHPDAFRKCHPEALEGWHLIILALGLSALAVALPAIFQKFTGLGITTLSWFSEETRRVTSWYGYPNAVGLYLAPIVVLFLGVFWLQIVNYGLRIADYGLRIMSYRRLNRIKLIFCAIVIIASLMAIIFAKSEGALFGVLAGIIFFGLFYPNKKFRATILVLLVFFVSLALLIPLSRNYAIEKLTFSDLSSQIRVQQWKETLNMLKDGRLLFGAGLAGYQTAVAPYHQEGIWLKDKNDPKWLDKILYNEEYRQTHWQPTEIYLYPHNFFLNFWSEIGLIGLLTVLAIMIKFVLGYWKLKDIEIRKQYLVLLAVMLAIFVHGLVDVPYFKNDLSFFWWLIIGLSASLITSSTKPAADSSKNCFSNL